MVTDEKPQILNCNILFYFKWIVQTITFKLWDKTQFKCNGLFYLIFAVFHLWPLKLLINNPVFYYNICVFFLPKNKSNLNEMFYPTIIGLFWENILETIELFDFLGFDFDFWPSEIVLLCHSKACTWLPVSLPLKFFLHISYGFEDIWLQSFKGLTLTIELWKSSEVRIFLPFESQYITSYLTSFDFQSCTVFEIFGFEVFRVWSWSLTFKSHLGVKNMFTIRKTIHDFQSNSYYHFLSRTVFEIFDFKVFRV